jgi:hypothetical protein
MSVTAILRGFKVPVAALDRFLRANGVMETYGYAPFYHRDLDDASKLLRARVGDGGSKTRLFIPFRMGNGQSTFAYVAYAWVFVYAQRKLHPLEELPDKAPEGFAELRNEVMKFATGEIEGEQPQTQDEDVTSMFVTITDERPFRFAEPFLRQVGRGILAWQTYTSQFILTAHFCSPICVVLTAVHFLLIILRSWRIAGMPMEPRNATMIFQVISEALGLSFEMGWDDIIMSGRGLNTANNTQISVLHVGW